MTYTFSNDTYILRFMPGEELMETLLAFVEEKNIEGGALIGLGAVQEVDLAYFRPSTKEYETKTFSGAYEVVNLTGNIATDKIHIHMTIGDEHHAVFAGHCMRAVANPTLEVTIFPMKKMQRALHEESGLQLLDLPNEFTLGA